MDGRKSTANDARSLLDERWPIVCMLFLLLDRLLLLGCVLRFLLGFFRWLMGHGLLQWIA